MAVYLREADPHDWTIRACRVLVGRKRFRKRNSLVTNKQRKPRAAKAARAERGARVSAERLLAEDDEMTVDPLGSIIRADTRAHLPRRQRCSCVRACLFRACFVREWWKPPNAPTSAIMRARVTHHKRHHTRARHAPTSAITRARVTHPKAPSRACASPVHTAGRSSQATYGPASPFRGGGVTAGVRQAFESLEARGVAVPALTSQFLTSVVLRGLLVRPLSREYDPYYVFKYNM
jgi:hypothetical protein